MIDLSSSYPFGIDRRNWPYFLGGLVVVLVAFLFLDHSLSLLATAQTPDTIQLFNEITRWGESDWLLYPSAGLLALATLAFLLIRRRLVKLALLEIIQMLGFVFLGIGLPSLAANLIKHPIGRARPPEFSQYGLFGFHPFTGNYFFQSFPSGHTATAFSAAMVLGFLSPRWFPAGLIYAAAVMASRVVLGAHYPTDVIGGLVIGTIGAYWVRNEFARRRWGFLVRADGHVVPRPAAALSRLFRRRQPRAAR